MKEIRKCPICGTQLLSTQISRFEATVDIATFAEDGHMFAVRETTTGVFKSGYAITCENGHTSEQMSERICDNKPTPLLYHFDIGNSSSGPVGYCCAMIACSEAEAVSNLRDQINCLGNAVDVPRSDINVDTEYISIYLNAEIISKDMIDEVGELTSDQLKQFNERLLKE